MSDPTALAPTGEPEARNSLIPLPDFPTESKWGDIAQAISQQYLREHPPHEQALFGAETSSGRTSLIADEQLIAAILQGVAHGSTALQAAEMCGMTQGTMRRWLDRAEREPTSAFATLSKALKMASEHRRSRLLQRVDSAGLAGPQYWTASAWLLERGFGNDYKLNVGNTAGQVIVNIGNVSAADIRIGGESVSDPLSAPTVIDVTPSK